MAATTSVSRINVVLSATNTNLRSQLTAAARDVDRFNNSVDKTGDTSNKAGQLLSTSFKVGIIAVGAALAFSAAQAVAFEKEMYNVTTISSYVADNFDAVSKSLVGMSKELPQSATELAAGLYDVASSGFAGREGLKVTEVAARAASAGLSTTAVAARAITGVLNAYGLEASSAREISDQMFQTVNLGVVTFDDLAQNLGDVIGLAASAKIPFKDVGTAVATITLAGIPAAEATTSLNRVIQSMLQPSDALAKVLHAVGYESGAQAIEQDGLQVVLNKVKEATGGNVSAMLELFPEIRAARGALALTAAEGENWKRVLKGMDDATRGQGATARALAQQQKSLAYQFQITKNQVIAMAIAVGTDLLPFLKALTSAVQFLLAGWEALPGPMRTIIVAAILMTTVFRGLLPAISGVLTTLAGPSAGISSTAVALRGAAAGADKLKSALPLLAAGLVIGAASFQLIGKSSGQTALGIGGMIAAGAMMGATLGPWGAAAGAAAGGIIGLGKALFGAGESAEEFQKRMAGAATAIDGLGKTAAVETFMNELKGMDRLLFAVGDNAGVKKASENLKELARTSPDAAKKVVAGLHEMRSETGKPVFNKKDFEEFDAAVEKSSRNFVKYNAHKADAQAENQRLAQTEQSAAAAIDVFAESTADATKRIRDMRSAIIESIGGEIGHEQALINVGEAQANLDKMLAEHPALSEEVRDAQLKLREAQNNLVASTYSLAEADKDLFDKYSAHPEQIQRDIDKFKELAAQNPETASSYDPIIARLEDFKRRVDELPAYKKMLLELDIKAAVSQFTTEIVGQIGVANGAAFRAFAGGGVENHVAQVAPAGANRLWAEPETGGEAYIPLSGSKRRRSTDILRYVANDFGYRLVPMADGGVIHSASKGNYGAHMTVYTTNVWSGPIYGEDAIKRAADSVMDERDRKLATKMRSYR